MTPTMSPPEQPKALPPVLQAQGQKPKQKSMQPSFLSSAETPTTGESGFKTLLGT